MTLLCLFLEGGGQGGRGVVYALAWDLGLICLDWDCKTGNFLCTLSELCGRVRLR